MKQLNDEQKQLICDYLSDNYKKAKRAVESTLNKFITWQDFDEKYRGICHEALVKAASRYNVNRGMRFSTFARMNIMSCVKTSLTYENRIKRKFNKFTDSLDAVIDDDGSCLYDLIANQLSNSGTTSDSETDIVEAVFKKMNKFERQVTSLLMYGFSAREICQKLHCTPKHIAAVKEITFKRVDIQEIISSYRDYRKEK